MRTIFNLFGYPLIDLGMLFIKAGAWCLGGKANIEQSVARDEDK